MRSLWRILALQWLGGHGSEALTEDSTILEGVPYGGNRVNRESSGDAGRPPEGGASTSPWRVTSVRQSSTPASPRRDDETIELTRTNPGR